MVLAMYGRRVECQHVGYNVMKMTNFDETSRWELRPGSMSSMIRGLSTQSAAGVRAYDLCIF